MGRFSRFEDIHAWQKARALTRRVYELTSRGAFSRDFGLRDQIRRASVSAMSNIAEGHERSGDGEFLRFLSIAKGSAGEVRAQLYVALDQGYVSAPEFEDLARDAEEVSKMVAGLMAHLRRSRAAPGS